VACWTDIPITSGTLTRAGPLETFTTTVSPCWYSESAAGCWPVIVPDGCWLFWSCCVCSFAPCVAAHCWATCRGCPTKFGTAGPPATKMVTGLVCGQVVPAAGLVPSTVPTGESEPTFWTVGTRCTCCKAACAALSVSPLTLGTTDVNGPDETRIVTAAPFPARPDGLVPTTVPFCTSLLCTGETPATVKPSVVSAVLAWPTESPATTGTDAYRPEASHQPPSPSPRPRTTTSATTASRGLNSQRCRNGSRPPWYRLPSSRCTTSVRELRPSWPDAPFPKPMDPKPPVLAGHPPDGHPPDGPVPGWPGPNALATGAAPDRLGSSGPLPGPLVAAAASRLSQGASARP